MQRFKRVVNLTLSISLSFILTNKSVQATSQNSKFDLPGPQKGLIKYDGYNLKHNTQIHLAPIKNYSVETITMKDGLAHGCIQYILQDSDGFMWFATEGGLNRYDGYNIKSYRCNDEFIYTIYEDPADSGKALWIGTRDGGLHKFDKEAEKFIQYQHIPDDTTSISHNSVTRIYKDKADIFWIGTFGGGLNRFDAQKKEFSSFQYNPNDPNSIRSDRVFAICEDYRDNLWIGTFGGGLELFNRKTRNFKHYGFNPDNPHTLPSKEIYSIYEDHQKVLWFGTSNGLFKYDRAADRFIRHQFVDTSTPNLNYGLIYSVTEDYEKTLWVASQAVGIMGLQRDRQKYIHISYKPGKKNALISGLVSHVCCDRSGVIWVGTFCQGINKLTPIRKPFMHYRKIPGDSNSLSSDRMFTFYEDRDRTLWVGTGHGLNRLENGYFKHYRFDDWFYENIFHIEQSKSGKLWLARGRCLTEFDPVTEKFINYFGKYKIYPQSIISMIDSLQTRQSEISFIGQVTNNKYIKLEFTIENPCDALIVAIGEGTYSGLVDYGWISLKSSGDTLWQMDPEKTRYAGGSWRNRVHISTISFNSGDYELHYRSNEMHGFNQWVEPPPKNTELWGIHIFKLAPFTKEKYQDKIERTVYQRLNWNDIDMLREDASGRLWCDLATTSPPLHYFDLNRKEFIPCQFITQEQTFKKLHGYYKDRDGDIWFYSQNNKLIRKDSSDNIDLIDISGQLLSMSDDSIRNTNLCIFHQDRQDFLWIGTEAGLIKYDKETKTVVFFDPENFASPNDIRSILEDDNGTLWMSTPKNIIKYNPLFNKVKIFDYRDGLPDMLFFGNCCLKRQNGQLLFGGNNGFISFHPDSLFENQFRPPVVFTDFRLFDKSIQPGKNSPLKKAISEAGQIVLQHDQNIFSFEFAALDFTAPNQNEYAYKMESVDLDWVFTDAYRRYVTYTSLSPGRYIFRVKCANNDGVWNERGRSIIITILPPWWRTTWAYASYVIMVLIILYSVRQYDLKRQRLKHELALEHEQARRLQEIDRMKSRFFANISHEFRTPLTLILGPLKKWLPLLRNMNLKRDLQMMQRNAQSLLRLINQLLDLSKLESGGMALQARKEEIVQLLRGYVQSFESLARIKKIDLSFIAENNFISAYVDREKIEKIMYNLLSNAFKYTPEGGRVTVSVSVTPQPSASPLMNKVGIKGGLEECVNISISDSGTGIPPDRIDKIFDRFYRIEDSEVIEHEGAGIGLALAKELVELHHGKISVASSPETGTTFTIKLPFGKNHLKEEEIAGSIPLSEQEDIEPLSETEIIKDEKTKIVRGLPLILIVEDNADVRFYIRGYIESNYRIIEAVDGKEGLQKAIEKIPDLVISDVMMPQMDGIELCRQIKTDERTSHIPVILLTARAKSQDKISGLEIGADDYLTKPFYAKELLVRIKNLISQRERLRNHFLKTYSFEYSDSDYTSVDKIFLTRIKSNIEEHLSDSEYGVSEFARAIGFSHSQFIRKLENLTGLKPSQFIRSYRLLRAKQMFDQKSGNISQVAYDCGFNNLSYFSRSFKAQFGSLPSEYMKQIS